MDKREEIRRKRVFGNFLKQLRATTKLSAPKLSELLGYSESYFTKLEVGQLNPTDEMIEKISDFFNQDESLLYNMIGKIPSLVIEEIRDNIELLETLMHISKNFSNEAKTVLYKQFKEMTNEVIKIEKVKDDRSILMMDYFKLLSEENQKELLFLAEYKLKRKG